MKNLKIMDIIQDLLSQLARSLPDVLGAVVVMIIGWLLAKVFSRLIRRFLVAVKVDRFAERLNRIELISKSRFNVTPSSVISKILYYLILIVAIIAATDILGMPALSNLMSDIINYIPSLLTAVLVLAVGLLVADFIKNIAETTCASLGIPSAKIISNVVFWFLFIVVLMSALAQAQINTTFITSSFIVIIGGVALAFSIGYGLASKDVMSNYLSSFTVKKRYRLGDVIKVSGNVGKIVEMDNTTVVLRSEDAYITVPMHVLTKEQVQLISRGES